MSLPIGLARIAALAVLLVATGFSAEKTESEWQQEAIRRFPDLGVPGSKLNQAFVAEYRRLKQIPEEKNFFNRRIWLILLAEKCSYALMLAASRAQALPPLPRENAFTRPANPSLSDSNRNLADREPAAKGELHVQNNTSRAAWVKILRNNQTINSFFIDASSSGEVGSLPDGDYSLLFALGNSFFRFNQPMRFFTTRRYGPQRQLETRYTINTVTLGEVLGGNVTASPISEEEFQRY
jgi:hypothetical protein